MPTWASVALAVATFILGSVVTLILDARRWGRQKRELDAAEDERRTRVARGISAWVDTAAGSTDSYLVVAKNAGDQPVYQCVLYVATGSPDHPAPSETVIGTLGPGQELREWVGMGHVGTVERFPHLPSISVRFTDPDGRHWLRDEQGRLQPQDHAALVC